MKKNIGYITHKQFKAKLLRDPGVRREYEKLRPEFDIASQMIEARLRKKMSQQELAKKVGTGQAVISRLEGMNAHPSISLLSRVAQALETKFEITIQ